MSWPIFCVNEQAFRDSVGIDSCFKESLEVFVSTMEEMAQIAEAPLIAHVSIYYTEIDANQTQLASLLFDSDAPDRDLRLRLSILLSRCEFFGQEADQRAEMVVEQEDHVYAIESHAARYALERGVVDRRYFGIVSRGEGGLKSGVARLKGENGSCIETLILMTSAQIPLAYRRCIICTLPDEKTFFKISGKAFPRLLLAPTLDFGHFRDGYKGTLEAVCDHLAFLNDEFLTIAMECNWDHGAMVARARISFSDESSNTKANRRAMRQREVRLNDRLVCCTLHTKLTPTSGRIHFHPPLGGNFGDRLVVGIFADHLET